MRTRCWLQYPAPACSMLSSASQECRPESLRGVCAESQGRLYVCTRPASVFSLGPFAFGTDQVRPKPRWLAGIFRRRAAPSLDTAAWTKTRSSGTWAVALHSRYVSDTPSRGVSVQWYKDIALFSCHGPCLSFPRCASANRDACRRFPTSRSSERPTP